MQAALRQVVLGLDRIADAVSRGSPGTVVLIYHRVGARSDSPVDLPLDVFRAHLDHLEERHSVVSLDSALDPLGSDGVVLTFDDGTADWVDVVLPELEARAMPATFYVSTDYVDRQLPWPNGGRPIPWGALAEMATSPLVTLGSHTHTHRVLRSASASETADELTRSFDLLGEHTGSVSRHFAYPKAILGSPAAEVQVRRLTASAVLAGNRVNGGRADAHRLGRHALTRTDTLNSFAAKAAGGRRIEGLARQWRDIRRG